MLRIAVVLVMLGSIACCAPAPRELKIGVLAPLSTVGAPVQEGLTLAIDEWNARGGVIGMKVVPLLRDTKGDPGSAAEAARQVITKDKVHYIVGDIFSGLSIAISEVANPAKVVQVTPTSTAEAVTVDVNGAAKGYVFRACFIDPFQGRVGATFAVKSLKAKRAFVMVDPNDVYVKGLAEAFMSSFTEDGGTVVGKEAYSPSDADFSKTLALVKSSKADVVYLPAISLPAVNLATRQAKQKGITATFMGGDGWDDLALDPAASDGSYFTAQFRADDPRPESQAFVKAYRGKYGGTPGMISALTYDATNLLLAAIKDAGVDNTDKVKAALERIALDGVTGTITMDAQHNPVKGAVVLHVTGGKVVFDSYASP